MLCICCLQERCSESHYIHSIVSSHAAKDVRIPEELNPCRLPKSSKRDRVPLLVLSSLDTQRQRSVFSKLIPIGVSALFIYQPGGRWDAPLVLPCFSMQRSLQCWLNTWSGIPGAEDSHVKWPAMDLRPERILITVLSCVILALSCPAYMF